MTLRRLPTDFRVLEALDGAWLAALSPTPSPHYPHAVYALTKVGQTTPEAVAHLAKALGVPAGQVAYAGLKDKHAQTIQHVTVPAPSATNQANPIAHPSELRGPHWSARLVGWTQEPIPAAAIARNHFEIVVRDLTRDAARQLLAAAEWLVGSAIDFGAPIPLWLLPNYFGDQRFGSARHHQGFAARALIQGDFETALKLLIATPARKDSGARRAFTRACASAWGGGDWQALARSLPAIPERRAVESLANSKGESSDDFKQAFAALPNFLQQLCVDAYQSHIWNAAAARCIIAEATVAHAPPDAPTHDTTIRFGPPALALPQSDLDLLARDGPFGTLLFAPTPTLESLTSHLLAMPAPDAVASPASDPRTVPYLQAALEAEGLKPERMTIPGLRRPRFAGAARPLIAQVESLTIQRPEPDELSNQRARAGRWKLALHFTLPRGAYATTLLRALGH